VNRHTSNSRRDPRIYTHKSPSAKVPYIDLCIVFVLVGKADRNAVSTQSTSSCFHSKGIGLVEERKGSYSRNAIVWRFLVLPLVYFRTTATMLDRRLF
jgi:hypothetical protein